MNLLLALLLASLTDDYPLQLARGESAEITVHQQGTDVIVDVYAPDGTLIDSVDGPTGRTGDEHATIIAKSPGTYAIRIRPYDANEPDGKFTFHVDAVRNVSATRQWLEERAAKRNEATQWLRAHNGTLESLASRARVIGIGEATHGSRELSDLRFALTRTLVEQHGFRIIAIEWSADGIAHRTASNGWIGRRTMAALFRWVDAWNAEHPNDRVQLVGVDAQENAPSRAALRDLAAMLAKWNDPEKELAAADEQTTVFGDSNVSAETNQYLGALRAKLADASEAARTLAQFADFNSNGTHSRDFYMASNVLRALDAAGPSSRAVFWAHNAHVAAPPNGKTSGAIIRASLGCGYAAIATTFGEGSFIAQMPNDLDDRIIASTLPAAEDDSIESVVAPLAFASWPCNVDASSLPTWLQSPHAMHWVGGLFTPGMPPSTATRPFNLVRDFDGIAYVPRVTAEDAPTNLPHIAARKR